MCDSRRDNGSARQACEVHRVVSIGCPNEDEAIEAKGKRDRAGKQPERQLDHVPADSMLRFQQEMQAMNPREVKEVVRQIVKEVFAEEMRSQQMGRTLRLHCWDNRVKSSRARPVAVAGATYLRSISK
jgi:hypothetical protein